MLTDENSNGFCDDCGAVIVDGGEGEPRVCSAFPDEHDPYSDGHNNGGDPII